MNPYNPYAPPLAGPQAPSPPGQPGPGGPRPWGIEEVYRLAWQGFKQSWGVLVAASVLVAIVSSIPAFILAGLEAAKVVTKGSVDYIALSIGSNFVQLVIQSVFGAGEIRMWLQAARGTSPDIGVLFSGVNRFFYMLAASLLIGVLTGVGFVFLIVPGVILSLGLALTLFYVADADMGPVEAAKASWEATKGSKAQLFLYFLAAILVVVLGLVACCVGVLASICVIWIGMAIIYIRLSGRGSDLGRGPSMSGAMPPPAAPGGWNPSGANYPSPGGWGPSP